MPARPRRGALGLRGRIVGAVLVTTVATLLVAALTLLGPLENSLRNAALKTLQNEGQSATGPFKRLTLTYYADAAVAPGAHDKNAATGRDERRDVAKQQATIANRIGATVILLGYFDQSGHGAAPITAPSDSDVAAIGSFEDASEAYVENRSISSFATVDGTDYARLALPITIGGHRFVLILRKPITEIAGAVHAIRTAFITAALAGLALTLILAIPLAFTIVRRLRRLRVAALQLAQSAPVVDLPIDRARDEVGDLARAFSIMQRRLQQQEEARRAFVATASHELRTPLASLDGMLELVYEDLSGGQPDLTDARALLERARVQSRRLGRLAADLLDLSRLDAQVQLRSEPIELAELGRAVMAEFELATADRGLNQVLDDSAGPVWARADPGSVARILRILIENAVRVSPTGSTITVELRNGEFARLSVCDEGPGVSPEERELIFERFQRGRDTGGQAGFGLGLAIGRELAERMGGELVHEDRDGGGAKFTLRLPAERTPESEPLLVS